jgi:hypothetical protein
MNFSKLTYIALATVGITEVLKNLIQKGGKRFWTIVTIFDGALMTVIAIYCPEIVLGGIVAVSGATVFYDTIYKSFQKFFSEKILKESE